MLQQAERKTILYTGVVWAFFLAICIIIEIWWNVGDTLWGFMYLIVIIALGFMLLTTPFQLFYLAVKSKWCPKQIQMDEKHIWMGEKRFSFADLEYIKVVSPLKKSDSILPVQYYLTIKEKGEKYKYWLGTAYSFEVYKEFCATLEKTMGEYSCKIRYKK